MNDNTYFAAQEKGKLAAILIAKKNKFYESLLASGYVEKINRLYAMYHGMDYNGSSSSHDIKFEGEQGELVSMNVNHLRNIASNMHTLITATRPTMETRAINTDYKSRVQTKLANGLLDYYMREKRLEWILRRACEYAIVLSSGWVRMEWDATAGSEIEEDEETGIKIYEGDVRVEVLSPFDIIFDASREDQDHDWYVVTSYKNKYDLASKYPDFADKIIDLPTKDKLEYRCGVSFGVDETTLIPVFEFFHKKSDSVPNGRYMLFLAEDVCLMDMPLQYPMIPLFRISPSDILGTPFGYTPLFDLMALQEAASMLYSVILTNQQAFGVQNIWVPSGAGISIESLAGGLNIIESNQALGKPEAINFTNTPKEIFDYLRFLIESMETISGVNSVVRGNPEASLRSASALALVQSNSIQFMSGLANQYNQLIEDVGTGLFRILKLYAKSKRVAAIVGVNNRSYLQEFNNDDLSNINRVIVSAANPLSKTSAGRMQMASELVQYTEITPRQYLTVLETGTLDSVIEGPMKDENLIVSENEMLLEGKMPIVTVLDKHSMHIARHREVISDAALRENPELVKVVLDHVQEHLTALRETDPTLLAMFGEQSLAPQPLPNTGQNMPAMGPDAAGAAPMPAAPMPAAPMADATGGQQLPSPPAGFEQQPLNGQQLQQKITG